VGTILVVAGENRVVCHACGSRWRRSRRGTCGGTVWTYLGTGSGFGLNRKASRLSPVLAQRRRIEGRRRWASNAGVRDGLAVGQVMARSGVLYELGAAAQPAGARRARGRRAATRDGAAPALAAHRSRQSAAARQRWEARAQVLSFADLEGYLTCRRNEGVTAHRVRTELDCGGTVAARLLEQGTDR
jgi:hypothetical protein